MNENTSGFPGLTSMVKMKAPATMLCFFMTKNLDSIPMILSVLPGSLLRECMATLRRVSGEGGDEEGVCLASAQREKGRERMEERGGGGGGVREGARRRDGERKEKGVDD